MEARLKSVVLAISLLSVGAAHAGTSSFSSVVNADTSAMLDVEWTWKWSGANATPDSSIPTLTNWSAEALGWREQVRAGKTNKYTYFLNVAAGPAKFDYEYDAGTMTSSPTKITSFHDVAVVGGRTYTLDIAQGKTPNELTAHLVAVVPEPESYAMFLAGLGLVGVITTRRRRGV